MLQSRTYSRPELNGLLADKLCARVNRLAREKAISMTASLVSEAFDWLREMDLAKIGVRPVYEAETLVGASLCNHNNAECDCGVHAHEDPH